MKYLLLVNLLIVVYKRLILTTSGILILQFTTRFSPQLVVTLSNLP